MIDYKEVFELVDKLSTLFDVEPDDIINSLIGVAWDEEQASMISFWIVNQ